MRWIVSDLVLREEREEENKKRKMTLRILVERRSMWSRVSFSTHRRLEISCRLTVWSLLRFLYVFTCDYVLGISALRHLRSSSSKPYIRLSRIARLLLQNLSGHIQQVGSSERLGLSSVDLKVERRRTLRLVVDYSSAPRSLLTKTVPRWRQSDCKCP